MRMSMGVMDLRQRENQIRVTDFGITRFINKSGFLMTKAG